MLTPATTGQAAERRKLQKEIGRDRSTCFALLTWSRCMVFKPQHRGVKKERTKVDERSRKDKQKGSY